MTIYMQTGEYFYVPSLDKTVWIHGPDYQQTLISAVGNDIVGFGQGEGVEVKIDDGKDDYVVTQDPEVVRKAAIKVRNKAIIKLKQV